MEASSLALFSELESLCDVSGRKIALNITLRPTFFHRMNSMRAGYFAVLMAVGIWSTIAVIVHGQDSEAKGKQASDSTQLAELLPIFDSIEDGLVASEELDRPVVVFFVASWCGPCKELTVALKQKFDAELLTPSSNSIFRNWVFVKIDVDERKEVAERFEIRGIPAMRVLDLNERVLAKTEGYESYAAIVEWLGNCRLTATPRVQRALQNSTALADVVQELIVLLGDRNVENRERAISRLSSDRKITQTSILALMQHGSLAQRLSSLEILKKWGVEVSGFDPWKPETFHEVRIAALRDAIGKEEIGKD